ncbi:hypothetical protein E4U43_003165 [Claviceps pusilla]|uniref:Uncharacterized protein n=1 Tax=Claviceps pusilla TaxID=123648 RepID=A0A9P7N563_9HYPO|nr:hypothetical protein E4U43_003165 [Claviceps pusilla]
MSKCKRSIMPSPPRQQQQQQQQQQQRRDTIPQGQKRRASSSLHEIDKVSQHNRPSKKQKLHYPDYFPPSFWDGLSRVWLTRNTLRELDRRNRTISSPSCRETARTLRVSPTLKGFAKQGGPDLTDLRGYQIPTRPHKRMRATQSSLGRRKRGSQSPVKRKTDISPSLPSADATSRTKTTKSIGPYDRVFQQHLIDHNIFPHLYKFHDGSRPPKPENLDQIRRAMGQRRPSLSSSRFSDDDFQTFQLLVADAFNETELAPDIMRSIEGHVPDRRCRATNIAFKNLDYLTDGTIVPGQPDLYYGARPEQLSSQVRQEQSGKIVPSFRPELPILANFFLEVKGPDGIPSVAPRQACYNGALGARGMQSLQSYGQPELKYDNKAYTISATYQLGQLTMYTSHPIPPCTPGERPGFAMTQVDTWALTGNADAFRQGASAFRNARDWAKEQRDAAIQQANQRVAAGSAGSALQDGDSGDDTTAKGQETVARVGSDTSVHELSADLIICYQCRQRHT